MRSITQHFAKLGAKFVNDRWSWGGIRDADGVVLLRVWQHDVKNVEGSSLVRVAAHSHYRANDPSNLGYVERIEHLRQIAEGAGCLLVFAEATNPNVRPRSIKDFDNERVFEGVNLRNVEGDDYLEFRNPRPARDEMQPA